ncbi:Uncharacterised protein [Salmonella enterica subsp. enterica serovar Typhi]|nr:Uncharacterised protein [Salmonella enterica subsp. enterica serovar Typhi]
MFLEQRRHNLFQLFGQRVSTQFRRVRQTVHHQGDAALLQRFGDGFPAELNQFFGVCRVGAFCHQLVEAQQRTGLQHTAQNGLLAHQVRFHFRHERRFQYARTVTAGGRSPGFSNRHTFAFRIVFRVNGDQRWHTEATLVFFTYFGARTLRCHHHHGDVFTDLLAHFDDVEAVGVTQRCAVFHQRLYRTYNVGVLFVRRKVNHQVSLRDQLFVGAYFEAVFGRFTPGGALLSNSFFTQGVGNIQTGVTHVQALVQTLSATADDDHFFTLQVARAVGEFVAAHKATFTQLRQLLAQIQCIKVVSHDGVLRDVVLSRLLFGLQIAICANEPTLQQEIYCGN